MATKKSRVSAGNGTAFTKQVTQPDPTSGPEFDPTRPRSFDLDAFISGARTQIPTRTIPVTVLPDVAAEAQELAAEIEKLERLVEAEKAPDAKPRRLSAPTKHRQDLDAKNTRLTELEDQLNGTWLLVKIRPLEPTEQDTIRRRKIPDGVELAAAIFEISTTVRPADDEGAPWEALTADQWVDLINAIGQVQYLSIDKAHASVTYQAVTPDFYERYSASRTTRNTSSS